MRFKQITPAIVAGAMKMKNKTITFIGSTKKEVFEKMKIKIHMEM